MKKSRERQEISRVHQFFSSLLDHLIPQHANGVHDKQNRVLSCHYCNRDCKGNYDPRTDAPKSAGRKELLKQAEKYVRQRQQSSFFDDLIKALHRR